MSRMTETTEYVRRTVKCLICDLPAQSHHGIHNFVEKEAEPTTDQKLMIEIIHLLEMGIEG